MRLTMLGTGHAGVTRCYNTCYLVEDDGRRLLVDAGGGNTILRQLKAIDCPVTGIESIIVTHKHIDHLLGVFWMLRMGCAAMNRSSRPNTINLYAHDEVISILNDTAPRLLTPGEARFINNGFNLIEVRDGEHVDIIGHDVTFFDIHSTKAKQYGYRMDLGNGRMLTCCGDEPFNEANRSMASGSAWLLHEAFCLHDQADVFKPYEKHHSTAYDAAKLAASLGVDNLLLYHTEDTDLEHRKQRYTAEAASVFAGNIYVPDDLDVITL